MFRWGGGDQLASLLPPPLPRHWTPHLRVDVFWLYPCKGAEPKEH